MSLKKTNDYYVHVTCRLTYGVADNHNIVVFHLII